MILSNDIVVLNSYDLIDIDGDDQNIIYKILNVNYKEHFEHNEQIVFNSYSNVTYDLVAYIQQALEIYNIDNSFITIIAPNDIKRMLDDVRKQYSSNLNSMNSIIGEHKSNYEFTKKPLPANFCLLPFIHTKITTQGKFRACCKYSDYLKDDDKHYDVRNDDLETVYHSSELTHLRESFLNNEQPHKCKVCWNLEANNNKSHRIDMFYYYKQFLHLVTFDKPNISNIISLDINLGISCNLKCRICSSNTSSKILNEELKHTNDLDVITQLNYDKKQGNYIKQNNDFWNIFNPVLSNIKKIYFFGGEPLTINYQVDFLKRLKNSKDIVLHYNTNGTLLSDKIVDVWNNFKEVHIAFSIDDVSERFEYQRSGANWHEVNNNIKRLITAKNNYTFAIHTTVNNQNVFYLPEVIDWFLTLGIDDLHLNILKHPKRMNIAYLDSNTKMSIIDKLSNSKHKERLNGIIELLYNSLDNISMVEDFITYTKNKDNLRNENFSDAHNEFAQLINF